jgi:hypothetical protein
MAVSSSTAANLVVGAGDVFLDNADVGATMDANTFAVESEWYVPDLNGVPGELQGTRYKTNETVRLGVTVVELTATKLKAALPLWSSAVSGTITTVDSDATRRVPTTDYHDWILQVDGLGTGSQWTQFNFYADNAVNDGGLEFEAADDGTMGYRAELMSTWDGAALTDSPFRIKIITGVSS